MQESRQKRVEKFKAACAADVEVEIVPSRKDLGYRDSARTELVGPYCRVSTMAESQAESYELQKDYYEEYVTRYPNWTLIDIYADQGLSATSMRKRKNFNRLITDCKEGKVTRIITKSVSRFARNVVDAISTVRMLRALPTPVGVYFETEHIDSLLRESDSQLSLLASFAESESLNKSTSMKWAIRGRFARHLPRLCDTYGFVRTYDMLAPDPVTGEIVAYMYDLLLDGLTVFAIAEFLTSLRIPTPTEKNTKWSPSTVFYILSNEKNCGDVFMQKTVTIDVFTHKAVKNNGIERMYKMRDHHEAIVSRDVWERAQAILGTYKMKDFILFDESSSVNILGTEYRILNAQKGIIR